MKKPAKFTIPANKIIHMQSCLVEIRGGRVIVTTIVSKLSKKPKTLDLSKK